ncbi:MAG: hypothetical protein KDB00_07845 [Planctomycetales bacterium]|nr:hypothetical protein [Planctomycetales bacterium]
MAKLKFALLLFVALVPFSVGCGSGNKPTVVEVDPNAEVDNAEYDQETSGGTAAASDESQN